MHLRLNGWVRLWMVLATIGFIASAAVAYISMPTPESVAHEASFDSQLSAEALAQRADDSDSTATRVRMSNGHVLSVKAPIEARKSTRLLAEYESLLDRVSVERRRMHFIRYALGWFSVSAALLLLGVAIAWVRRGFVSSRNAQ